MKPSATHPGTVPARMGLRDATARWLAVSHPAGLMHGAVVTAAVLAVVGEQEAPAAVVVAVAVAVLVVYWLTHAYTYALSVAITGEQQHRLTRRLLSSARHEAALLRGGAPAVLTFAVALAAGASFSGAVRLALWLSLILLAVFGYVAGHLAGVRGWRLTGETAFAALVGACIVVLQTLLH